MSRRDCGVLEKRSEQPFDETRVLDTLMLGQRAVAATSLA
jgi:hypothetical protein